MFRSFIAAVTLVLAAAPTAYADSGSLTDPSGDYPDILKLTYNNKSDRVIMTMKYADFRPQNESFYMRWGKDAAKYYQVFVSSSAGMKELRLNGTKVKCGTLAVSHDATKVVTRVVVRRSCLDKAPDKLRFKGIATEGTMSVDETKLSAAIARG